MKEIALKVIGEIEKAGYEAYIVGGFVRDFLIGIESNDIDITTNATPKDLCQIFKDAIMPTIEYGSVTLFVNQIRFEITTFRKEFNYQNNRRPGEVIYINSLKEDLLRRDFTINTICMNSKSQIVDLLNAQQDLAAKKIKTVQNSQASFTEDALRILRAIRFATILNFSLDEEIKDAIYQTKYLLKSLSKERVKEELTKIFSSPNAKAGISLILQLEIDKVLNLSLLSNIKYLSQSIGIWAFLEVDDKYPFSKNEKELMTKIRQVKQDDFSLYSLYQNGLYASSVAGEMMGYNKAEIVARYNSLPIKKSKDLAINGMDILKLFQKIPGPYLGKWMKLIEKEVVLGHLKNDKEEILSYCLNNSSMVG